MSKSTEKQAVRFLAIVLVVGVALALSVAIAGATASAPGWMQSNTSGFGQPENYNAGALGTFGTQMYAGTWNEGGAQVWRTADGKTWNQVTPGWSLSNTEVYYATPFGAYLYVGTGNMAGGEIWRSDGTGWEQVASAGLGDTNNDGFDASAVLSGALYVATANLPPAIGGTGDGVEVWRSTSGDAGSWVQVNDDGFGGGPTWTDVSMDVYQEHLYVGLSRVVGSGGSLAELWRSDGATWTPVFTDGLGDADNSHVAALAEFQGDLYIGLRNATTGGQVWRSGNGLDWTPVFTDGLGSAANSRPYGLIADNSHLVVVFSNMATGVQVWQTGDGVSWQEIAAGGWGNGNNMFADYFDKAAVVFRGALYIGTMNEVDGGEIWRRLHTVYLPLVLKNLGPCSPTWFDDFSDIHSGWPIEDDASHTFAYTGGEYQIVGKDTDWALVATPGVQMTDGVIVVDMRFASATGGNGDNGGIMFGQKLDNGQNYYRFTVTRNGMYCIQRHVDGSGWVALKCDTATGYLPYPATNRLKVVRDGSAITAYINGQFLATVSDSNYLGSLRVGLSAGSGTNSADLRFDDYGIYPVSCSDQVSANPGIERQVTSAR
jgi:hypothetical protein